MLLAGVSTRAVAESAARTGFRVTALDAFADLDQHAGVRASAVAGEAGGRYTAGAAARAGGAIACDAVAYVSDFENHASAVRTLARGRALWGNPPAVLARVRAPGALAVALRARGHAAPATATAEHAGAAAARWLVKPHASGGGRGVRSWRRDTGVPRGCSLQEYVDGVPGSVVFVADGRRAVVLGMSRQLVGEGAFGARGFRYCGSVLAGAGDAQFAADCALLAAAAGLADAATDAFGLVGVNGVDFIACDGVPHAIEVNPRYTASMELVEHAYGVSVFGAHAAACAGGALPAFDVRAARRGARATGKAVLFAPRALVAGDTRPWLDDPSVRDVPRPGQPIPAGGPVCTVFADGTDAAACRDALVRRARAVYDALGVPERAAA